MFAIQYYEQLEAEHKDHNTCLATMNQDFSSCTKQALTSNIDTNSSIWTYMQINLNLEPPSYQKDTMESDRQLMTQYRTGSHYLKIEKGRWSRILIEICDFVINVITNQYKH